MKCPVCKEITLLMSEKKWIEIDYCPECRGVWLDRGELEKLMVAEAQYYSEPTSSQSSHSQSHSEPYPRHRKKESFLEIFDFGD